MINIKLCENSQSANKKGLIKAIIMIFIALIVLGYFGFNIKDIVSGPTVQANLSAAWEFVSKVWNNYLAAPVMYVFGLIWKLILAGMPAK